jgi:hypothetical protein
MVLYLQAVAGRIVKDPSGEARSQVVVSGHDRDSFSLQIELEPVNSRSMKVGYCTSPTPLAALKPSVPATIISRTQRMPGA